jgi:hypothetical protein
MFIVQKQKFLFAGAILLAVPILIAQKGHAKIKNMGFIMIFNRFKICINVLSAKLFAPSVVGLFFYKTIKNSKFSSKVFCQTPYCLCLKKQLNYKQIFFMPGFISEIVGRFPYCGSYAYCSHNKCIFYFIRKA